MFHDELLVQGKETTYFHSRVGSPHVGLQEKKSTVFHTHVVSPDVQGKESTDFHTHVASQQYVQIKIITDVFVSGAAVP